MKIIGDTWFTTYKANFGIVLYEDRHGNIKSKIDIVHGKDLDADIKNIIDYGSFFPVEAAIVLMECKKRYFYEIKKKPELIWTLLLKNRLEHQKRTRKSGPIILRGLFKHPIF